MEIYIKIYICRNSDSNYDNFDRNFLKSMYIKNKCTLSMHMVFNTFMETQILKINNLTLINKNKEDIKTLI